MLLREQNNFYSRILSLLQVKATKDVNTMAVTIENNKYLLFYNPSWFQAKCTVEEATTVVEHECLHLMLRHIPRYLKFLKDNPSVVKEQLDMVSNIAMDEAVNSILIKAGRKLPQGHIDPEDYKHRRGLSTEKYLHLWLDQLPYLPEESPSSHLWIQSIRSSIEKGDSSIEEIMKDLDVQLKQIAAKIDKELRAKGHSLNDVPSVIKKFLKEFLEPSEIPWEEVLKQYVQNSINQSPKRNNGRPNRRMHNMAVSPFPGKKSEDTYSVAFMVDTSGSMSDAELFKGLGIIQDIMQVNPEINCTVVEFDTKVLRTYDLKEGNKQPTREIVGRGGTNFNPPFEWFKDHSQSYDIIVFYTDGFAPDPKQSLIPNIPLIWLLTKNHEKPFEGNVGIYLITK